MAAERQTAWQGSFHFCRLCCLLLIIFGLLGVCRSNIEIYPKTAEVGQLVNITCLDTIAYCPRGRVLIACSKDPNGNLSGVENEVRTSNELRLTVRMTEPQSVYYFCLCDVGNATYNATYLTGMQKFEAGYAPTPAVNFTCVSFAWEELECSWSQAGVSSLVPTTTWNVTFTAYIRGTEIVAHSLNTKLENRTCLVDAGKLTCRIDTDEILKYKFYRFSLMAENALGTTARASFNVTTDESIVKPPTPTNISVVSTAANVSSSNFTLSGCRATLSWTAGGANLTAMFILITGQGLQYKLTYRETGRKRNHSQVFVSKNETVSTVLNELRPFAEYTVVITSRVAKYGILWSEPVSFNFTTCEAAPEVPPVVNSQLGYSHEEDMDCSGEGQGRGVTLYWQGIPEVSGQSNGIVTGYYIMDGEKVVAEAEGKARQKSFCMRKLDGGVTYALSGATAAGRGVRVSEIDVPPQPQQPASGLRLRACEISAIKTTRSTVEVYWTALSHDGAANVVRENNIYGGSSAASKQRRQEERRQNTEQQRYVVFWCQYDGRSQCTGDIKWSPPVRVRQQWPHNQTVGHYQVNVTGGSVYHYRFGVALWTPANISRGITWAGCVHSNDGDRSKVPEPHVSLMYGDTYSAKIKQLECFRGAIELSRPIVRVFYWCKLLANGNDSCTVEMDEIPSCCEQESVRSFVLNGCDNEAVMRGSGSGVAVWIKHIYLHKDYAFSSVRIFTPASAEPQHAADRMWTSAVIWGTIVGVACVAAIIAVLVRTYLRMTTMNITTIKKVPTVLEVLARDDYADRQQVFDSEEGLYLPQAGRKIKISRSLLERSMPARGIRRQRDRQSVAALQGNCRRGNAVNEGQHYAADCLSTSTCCDEESVGRDAKASNDPLGICQTCIGFNVTGDGPCAMPSADGLLSRDRYIRSPMAEDALYKMAAQAAAAKLHILNWLPISKSSDTSIRQQESVISEYFLSDCAGGTSVSELSVVRRPGSTQNVDQRKKFTSGADKLSNQLDMAVAASAGASCPILATSDELTGTDKRSQTGASSQMTASTSCSSLGYWKTSQDGIHQVGRRLSVDEVKAAVIVEMAPKRKLSAEEEYFEARVASSLGRRSVISLVPGSGKFGPCLDYI